ncbi:gamma-glutamyltransferase family protein [Salipaludibacillus daqingensis]|uniref:gamma-glutamyltransferase family protein n=1 Tax=Salipaludibacillus daqingensis TaxID=3041001 RepID=UPI002475A714|nr:gamma-glutamyltransferase [Salipaludibacillus daqingensis]
MNNYKVYLKITHILAGIIFIGLISWSVYFEGEFDQFREPYSGSDFQDRQVDSVEVSQNNDTSSNVNNNVEETNESDENNAAEDFPGIYGVSSIHPLAAEVGMNVIEDGGNAIDAAVAVSFMLNVVEPYGSGIGGGGLMLVHDRQDGAITYDYREAAPIEGDVNSPFAVPGLVKGMEKAFEEKGSGNISWEDLLDPAVTVAREGFEVGQVLHEQIANSTRYVQFDDPNIREIYYPGGQPIEINETLIQEELADTLELIKENGAAGFYEGETAIAMQEAFGFDENDLTSYEAMTTETVTAEIGDQILHGGPSPSSGTTVVQAMQMANNLDLSRVLSDEVISDLEEKLAEDGIDREARLGDLINYDEYTHSYIHLITEITQKTYSERLDTLGDPEFEMIDHAEFTSQQTIDRLLDEVYSQSSGAATSGETAQLFDSPGEENDSRHTTHYVIVDKEGTMVSATNSLGQFFGSGVYSDGIFINSQMENFSDREESKNSYAPGKRPRSFVAPMIFEEQGQAVLGLGSPGGRRIPAMVFQTIMQYQYGLNEENEKLTLQEAIQQPRFYTEDGVVHVERRLDDEINALLRDSNVDTGYSVIEHGSPLFYGGIQGLGVVLNEDGRAESMYGGGDPRRRGSWQIDSED